MRVLLVEDNPDDALIIEDMLSATAVEIEHASNLLLALEKLTRGNLDLVLLDLSLPDARGATAPNYRFVCRSSYMRRKTNVPINPEDCFVP